MSATNTTPSPPHEDNSDSRPHRLRWIVLVVVMTANIMDAMDSTIANIAGPSVRRDLGGGASTLQWISAGYTLAFAVLLIAGARLGDIFGRRRVFLLGLSGFTLFSAVCAAAPSMPVLILSRMLQGGFGALMIPQGFGFLKQVFPDQNEFDKAMGFVGPASGLPLLAAPVLAGALIDANLWHIGWRLVFLINVPIGVLALLLAIPALPDSARRPALRLDSTGVWLVGFALVAIIYPLIQGRADGWPVWIFALLVGGLLLLIAFLRHERRHKENALIEPSLLSNRTYLTGIAVVLFFFGGFAGLLLCVSLFGQLGEGWSPIHAGLSLTPMVIGIIVGMTASFALVSRLGRHLLHLGILLIAAGDICVALTLTGAHTASTWDLVPGLLLTGVGAGASFAQLFGFVLGSVNMDEVGSASGVLEATQQLSTSLGVAVLGTIFFSAFGPHLATDALQITAWACLAPLLGAFLLIFRLPMRPRDEQEGAQPSDGRRPSAVSAQPS
jgi:EmrB/QacA subfamily drug resistance transporter